MLVVLPLGYSHCKVCGTVDRCAEAFKGSFGKVKTALAISERHRCWLRKRLAPEGAREGWRPQKVFRSAARKWVKTIDNQVRYSSSWLGIAHVRFVGDSPLWSPASWRSWPLLQCVQDQGRIVWRVGTPWHMGKAATRKQCGIGHMVCRMIGRARSGAQGCGRWSCC